ncbi:MULTISPECIES: hypothetical protein [unclassified Tolypothrix]|uniref:hypothetical protein n=1 Tax=unclassified Tolypothrix TaxID=2649714 RepID=UPI0005EAC218|nr:MULTISPECIES: hypothetical protein [unclassified Tolypothrix]BAY91034.1 hypothetical protein NIES3275_30540 [Microchaete diplosiphon NIES-3275]EKE99704.1 hypothetical protein FDUTEX481_09581 [Tolypothrix sp. PCC 7601]MBE9081605.1 hypothetical protein [Tolypothrix sp. LEGE 11397]UYD25136.1 hypothetical protein HGR01_27655 [Tolypothrix sp. PCC 7712]UYD32625.1 hypothetical protein HG267_26965 [Tolypothrix sp. PCC 7601]
MLIQGANIKVSVSFFDADISARDLEPRYLDTNGSILLLQKLASLVMMQQLLDLPVDAGLAYQIKIFQSQFKTKASYVQNQLVPMYISHLASASNFEALFSAFVTIGEPLIRQATGDSKQRASEISLLLSEFADIHNSQTLTIGAKNIGVIKNRVSQLQNNFNDAITNAIQQMGDTVAATNLEIDKLENEIRKNISDIVSGANKVGGALRELGIGVLTEITKINASTENAAKPKSATEDDSTDNDGEITEDNVTAGSLGVPSVNFVVSAITGAEAGAAESAQARADLNSNNQKLADAYQKLAQVNALVATAKVIQLQNRMFASEMKMIQEKISNLATTWGQNPVISTGSGISLGFYDYAGQITEIITASDANPLLTSLRSATVSWNSLNDQLIDIKQELSGVL